MQVHRNIDELPVFRKPVLTIGTFDGVHLGHRQILQQLQAEAARVDGETVILTFHPHPRTVVGTSLPPIHLINTIEERTELLSPFIDHLVVVPFTELFSRMSAEAYVEHFLVERFHPHTVIIGYDHRFGAGRKGDYHLLESFRDQRLFNLIEISPHVLDHNAVSSTRIRNAIAAGDLETANTLLGYDFFFEGTVIEGTRLGRTLGYPTANLQMANEEKLIPGNGVYAVLASIDRDEKNIQKGMMNIGFRPTVGGSTKMIEVHLFDFDAAIYSKRLRVFVKKKLRDEKKFPGLEDLKKQLAKDKLETLALNY